MDSRDRDGSDGDAVAGFKLGHYRMIRNEKRANVLRPRTVGRGQRLLRCLSGLVERSYQALCIVLRRIDRRLVALSELAQDRLKPNSAARALPTMLTSSLATFRYVSQNASCRKRAIAHDDPAIPPDGPAPDLERLRQPGGGFAILTGIAKVRITAAKKPVAAAALVSRSLAGIYNESTGP